MDLTQLLKLTTEKKASDLHIIAGYNPSIRVNDKLIQLKTHEQVTKDTAKTAKAVKEKVDNTAQNKKAALSAITGAVKNVITNLRSAGGLKATILVSLVILGIVIYQFGYKKGVFGFIAKKIPKISLRK